MVEAVSILAESQPQIEARIYKTREKDEKNDLSIIEYPIAIS